MKLTERKRGIYINKDVFSPKAWCVLLFTGFMGLIVSIKKVV